MVAERSNIAAVTEALSRLDAILSARGPYACPICGLPGLDETALRAHSELSHQIDGMIRTTCPLCAGGAKVPICFHLKNAHGPLHSREPPPAPFAAFAWAVVRRACDGKFLLVHEPAAIARGLPRFWLPAGRVDAGENFVQACVRECAEEAGLAVRATGVLRVMAEERKVLRVALLCEPVDESVSEVKAVPDWESLGACWVDGDELQRLTSDDLRASVECIEQAARGTPPAKTLETSEWRAFEAAIARATASGEDEALMTAVKGVVAVYGEQMA